ncbi:hypothetical protein [Euzebya rosea]|uniref:hypothetical protein n=1 Tax=Euzebya rosea TaxID=2052804 RepID=UPI0013007A9D|nr:hypothetical protein [Euzebya rosea]
MSEEELPPTLGPVVIDWMEDHLVHGPGPIEGDPFVLPVEHRAFVCRLLELQVLPDGDPGPWGVGVRWRWRRAHLERIKQWMKSPLAGALGLAALAGPWRYDGLDSYGDPVGVPIRSARVLAYAVSEDQADFMFKPARGMALGSDIASRFDVTMDRIATADGSGEFSPQSSRMKSKIGDGADLVMLDQTESWTTHDLTKLAEEATRQAAKRSGLRLDLANAGSPGGGSVAEEARKPSPTALVDVRASDGTHDVSTRRGRRDALLQARGDADWIDVEGLLDDADDPTVDLAEWIRWYTGLWAESADQPCTKDRWTAVFERKADPVSAGDKVVLGWHGRRDDAAALVVCRLHDGKVRLQNLWERPEGSAGEDWEIGEDVVDRAVSAAMEIYRVAILAVDPPHWRSMLLRWTRRWKPYRDGPVLAVQTQKPAQFGPHVDAFLEELRGVTFAADVDERHARHIGNARKSTASGYTTLVRAGRAQPHTAAVSTAIARAARAVALTKPPKSWGRNRADAPVLITY